MEKKKFENPELTIIYFEGNLATEENITVSGDANEWPSGDFDD